MLLHYSEHELEFPSFGTKESKEEKTERLRRKLEARKAAMSAARDNQAAEKEAASVFLSAWDALLPQVGLRGARVTDERRHTGVVILELPNRLLAAILALKSDAPRAAREIFGPDLIEGPIGAIGAAETTTVLVTLTGVFSAEKAASRTVWMLQKLPERVEKFISTDWVEEAAREIARLEAELGEAAMEAAG